MRGRLLPLAAAWLLGCSGEPAQPLPDQPDQPLPDAANGEWSFTTLEERSVTVNNSAFTIELIRATRPDGGRSYLLYQRAPSAKAPVVINTEPYAGIDWTQDPLDQRWAAQGNGSQPDRDAPAYDGDDVIGYTAQSVEEAVAANNIWTFNGFASLRAYGRFYAGGTLEDDALDAAAPYYFAKSRADELDLSRIGAYGASWGGMMVLFGAQRAPAEARPRAAVAVAPPSDFVDFWRYTEEQLPALAGNPQAARAFFSPYWRRATPSLGTPPGGDAALPFTHAGLCPRLPGNVLVPHDTWDMLVPVTQTEALARACANVTPLYWPRATPLDYQTAPLDHGPAFAEGDIPSVLVFSYSYLVTQLAPAEAEQLYTVSSQPGLVAHLRLLEAAQRAGQNIDYLLPRLRDLVEPRLQVFLFETGTFQPSAEVLAAAVNEVWQTSFDGDSLRQQLTSGLPSSPQP